MSEENVIVYRGASASQLGVMFGMTPQQVNNRIAGKIEPSKAGKVPLYRLRDAAPHLCNPIFDVEAFLKGLAPSKLPPQLQSSFWDGQNKRIEYEENRGDLWRTTRVIEVLGEVFKTIAMTVRMFEDNLEQEHELSPEQRAAVKRLGEGLLAMAKASLVEKFKNYEPPDDEHGRPLDQEEDHHQLQSTMIAEAEFDDGFDD